MSSKAWVLFESGIPYWVSRVELEDICNLWSYWCDIDDRKLYKKVGFVLVLAQKHWYAGLYRVVRTSL